MKMIPTADEELNAHTAPSAIIFGESPPIVTSALFFATEPNNCPDAVNTFSASFKARSPVQAAEIGSSDLHCGSRPVSGPDTQAAVTNVSLEFQ